jgi:hypothetical protein
MRDKNIPMRRIYRELFPSQVVEPPGGYGDGPAFLRVRRSAGEQWRRRGLGLSSLRDHPTLGVDPDYEYIRADNTHGAFVYRAWLAEAGVEPEALTVVRYTSG